MDFQSLLRDAGEWTNGITLRKADWNQEAGKLTIELYSAKPVGEEERAALSSLFADRLSFCEVETRIDAPAFAAPVKPAVTPGGEKDAQKKVTLFGKAITRGQVTKMCDARPELGTILVEGKLLHIEKKIPKNNSQFALILLSLTDFTNTIRAKGRMAVKEATAFENALTDAMKGGGLLRLRGDCQYDRFEKDTVLQYTDVVYMAGHTRADTEKDKRVELHLHTKMSAMDALTDMTAAIKTAARFGHNAIAVTDHGVVQAFPEAYEAGKKHGVKILYGCEGYLRQDSVPIPMDRDYVVFDLETTGFKPATDHIIEIGAVRISSGRIVDRFATFVDAGAFIPPNIVKLTGITADMVQGAPSPEEALRAFYAFCTEGGTGCALVAHNSSFDIGFLSAHAERYGLTFDMPSVDTLRLSRYLLFGLSNHKLNTVCAHLNVALENHHRAVDDAQATAEVFLALLARIRALGVDTVPADIHKDDKTKSRPNHIVLLAKTQEGMRNLYRLVSHAHLDFFHHRPQIPKYLLALFREGLLLGSACEQGEVFQAILRGAPEDELLALADWYDYLEIQPIENNAFLVREGRVKDDEGLRALNRRVVELGAALHKPVVATGDVHFLEPEDALFRAILMHEMNYSDADSQPPLYYMTTEEMLAEFAYLGEDGARAAVVEAPNAIADSCMELKPFPDGTFAPKLEGAEEKLRETALSRAQALYGEPLPEPVQKRLDRELKSIIDNGYASLYVTAQMLVQKSMNDGYLVGSRGSVGSSLVATMAGITEVNPLPPHYLCEACGYSDFDVDTAAYACGADMPAADCPRCGAALYREGFDIPFEVFLGFRGDKTPDIDLNFSGEYQPEAHKYTEEMFGEGHAFRAGTISGIQSKTAYGYVMKYLEAKGLTVTRLEIDRLCAGCSGVKRTTGQHPGGIVVLPEERDILEFTPIQYPADERGKNTITTHFDFNALHDRLVKLDILGHADPTALKMLGDLTGVDPRGIPLGDPGALSLFSTTEGLDVDLSALNDCDVGSLGLPEFGTSFVRQMLMDTRPTTLEELVRIAGLSHGTDVWLNNAQELVASGTATLRDVVCTRDDIMNSLIARGCDPLAAFKIMENVRKGKGLTQDMERAIRQCGAPEWFVDSCKKIQYMFPRAHAVAYVLMSFRVAYYKYHHPEAFYAAYFTVRAEAFDILLARGGAENVLANLRTIWKKGKEASKQETTLATALEVVYEMNLRGIAMLDVDIYRSDARRFLIEEEGIRPPFLAMAGVGDTAAQSIAERVEAECAKSGRFHTVQDFQVKTGANIAVIAAMKEAGCFSGMADSNQISLF